ncbi:MAG: thiol-disulfide oxidoreductase DCC family protein [Gammaproteobacteria bacterium]
MTRYDQARLILFDGECTLCNRSVRFVLEHERRPRFKFASLQSRVGQVLLERHRLPRDSFESFVLIENNRAHLKSSAALRVARQLRAPWPLLSLFLFVPRSLRDGVYDFIGARRFRWFGRTDYCWSNSAAWRSRFIDSD